MGMRLDNEDFHYDQFDEDVVVEVVRYELKRWIDGALIYQALSTTASRLEIDPLYISDFFDDGPIECWRTIGAGEPTLLWTKDAL